MRFTLAIQGCWFEPSHGNNELLIFTIMEQKETWREFAESTGFGQSFKEIAIGMAVGIGILVLAGIGQAIAEWLEKVF